MKRLTKLGAALLVALLLAVSLTACDTDDTTSAGCYEIDIDHPKAKKTPKTSKPNAPAYKVPKTRRR